MRSTIQYILKILAKATLKRHKPEIIAITGSVGKTGVREAIYRVLKKEFRVRRSIKNYNNEIGVPLTILGSDEAPSTRLIGLFGWLAIFVKAIFGIIWGKDYPEILILEMGVAKPGDMKYLLSFVPVKVGVITAIGEFPSHLEFFPEKNALVNEKALLAKSLPKKGLAVLNYDDLSVREISRGLSCKTVSYGFSEGADLKIENYEMRPDPLASFKLAYKGSVVPVKLKTLGKQKAFAAAAAAAVGLHYGLNLVQISSALAKYGSIPGRTNLIKGIKGTGIIDDAYNASPLSTLAALEILDIFPSRKVAVLGDMLELGDKTEEGHRQVGQKAAEMVDLLFTIGDRGRFIADEAAKRGFPKDKIFKFSTSDEARLKVQEEIKEGDTILIKGSRGMKMEKITEEIMLHPEKAAKLLSYAH